jgi:uncharacterized membrane protein YesL
MLILAIGSCLYLVVSYCVIYYNMYVMKKTPLWLSIYLPVSVICYLAIMAVAYPYLA